jgi:hypothetical protein
MLAALASMCFVTASKAQNLTEVRVEFDLPHGDDRDHDTRTAIRIMKGDIILAAEDNVAPGMHLSDPGHYGPFNIPVRVPISKGEYYGSKTVVEDFPNGNDTWITHVIIIARFSNGEELRTVSDLITFHNRDRKEFPN